MYYPLFINLKDKKVLVIGSGKVGSRRALYLVKAGAKVAVISKDFSNQLLKIRNKSLKLIKKQIDNKNINGINFNDYFLIIIATDDNKLNDKLSNEIKKINKKSKNQTLICRADKHLKGDIIFPAYVAKGGIGITSFGKDTKKIKRIKNLMLK